MYQWVCALLNNMPWSWCHDGLVEANYTAVPLATSQFNSNCIYSPREILQQCNLEWVITSGTIKHTYWGKAKHFRNITFVSEVIQLNLWLAHQWIKWTSDKRYWSMKVVTFYLGMAKKISNLLLWCMYYIRSRITTKGGLTLKPREALTMNTHRRRGQRWKGAAPKTAHLRLLNTSPYI